MSMFTKTGAAAITSTAGESGGKSSAMLTFNSGMTLKVRVKCTEKNEKGEFLLSDIVEYYAYSMFNPRVNTFVPANPAKRNDRGYVVADPTVWDRASQLLYDDAKKAKEAGDEAREKALKDQAGQFKGKPKYLIAFGNLADGKDIVVDLTKKQKDAVLATITKYAKKLDKLAFELTKSGESTATVVTLSPILDMDEDLTPEERANFEKCGAVPFDFAEFESCLYVADETEQIKNLVIAGFDIGRLGLTYGGSVGEPKEPAANNAPDEAVTPITGDAPAVNF